MNCIQQKMRYIVPLHKLIMDFTFCTILVLYISQICKSKFLIQTCLKFHHSILTSHRYWLKCGLRKPTEEGSLSLYVLLRSLVGGRMFGMEALNGAIKSLRSCCRGNSYLFLSSNVFHIQNGDIEGGH